MAVTLLSKPTTDNVTGTKLVYTVSGSDISHPQYSYVLDVYLAGSSELLARQFQTPNPEGIAEFQPSPIFDNYLSYDNFWKINQLYIVDPNDTGSIGYPIEASKEFNVKIGEAYSTSPSSSVTVYPGTTDNLIRIFKGTLDPAENNLLNSGYNFNSSSFGQASGPRSNLLTNYPTQNLSIGSVFEWIEDTQFHSTNDYATVTQYNNTIPVPALASVGVQGYLNVGTARSIVFNETLGSGGGLASNLYQSQFTWGIGPANLKQIFDPVLGVFLFKEYIDSGSVNEIEFNLPGYDNTRYFIRENVFNNKVYQEDLDITLPVQDEDNLRVPLNTEFLQFAFINQFGFYDYYTVFGPLRRSSQVDRESVSLPKVDYSSTVSTYSLESGGETVYNTEFQDTYSITTDWLSKTISNWLEELLDSPEVFVRQGDEFVPITITNTSYEHNEVEARNKLFQYTIEFQPSNGRDLTVEEYEPLNQIDVITFHNHFESDCFPTTRNNARLRSLVNYDRDVLPVYSRDWRLNLDILNLRLDNPGSLDASDVFVYTPATIGFSPNFRLFRGQGGGGGGQPRFDEDTYIKIEVKGDDTTLYYSQEFYPASNDRAIQLPRFTVDFTGDYNNIYFSSSVSCNPFPTPTPTATPTSTVTPTPSITPSITPTQTVTPTVTPTLTPTPSITPTLTPTPTPSTLLYDQYIRCDDGLVRRDVSPSAPDPNTDNERYIDTTDCLYWIKSGSATNVVPTITTLQLVSGSGCYQYPTGSSITQSLIDVNMIGSITDNEQTTLFGPNINRVRVDADDNLLMAGAFTSVSGSTSVFKIAKMDFSGSIDSNVSYPYTRTADRMYELLHYPAKDYYIAAGQIATSFGSYSGSMAIISSSGDVLFTAEDLGENYNNFNGAGIIGDYVYLSVGTPNTNTYVLTRVDLNTLTEDLTWRNQASVTNAGNTNNIGRLTTTNGLINVTNQSNNIQLWSTSSLGTGATFPDLKTPNITAGQAYGWKHYTGIEYYAYGTIAEIQLGAGSFADAHGILKLSGSSGTAGASNIDPSWQYPTASVGTVYDVGIQSDGKVIVAGNLTPSNFIGADGCEVGNIVRLNTDGTLDKTFMSPQGVGSINSIHVFDDDSIIAVGSVTGYYINGLQTGSLPGGVVVMDNNGNVAEYI